ncbi:reverse transcriptase domain-containing protein [Tanacetum coccineum]
MDDEPMWAADHVVAPTPGSAITIPETAKRRGGCAWLRMKEMLQNCHGHILSKGNIIKIFYHGLSEITQEVLNAAVDDIFLYKTPNQAYQLLEDNVLLKLDGAKNKKTKPSLKKTVAFIDEGRNNSNTDKNMARMDAMTLKMDAQYKELQNHAKKTKPDLDEDDIPISNTDDKPYDLQKQFNDFMKSQQSANAFVKETLADKQSGRPSGSLPSYLMPYSLYAKLSLENLKPTKMSLRLADRSFQYHVGIAENMLVEVGKFTFLSDFVILEMEEDSKVPLILGRPFLHTTSRIQVKQKTTQPGYGT